MQRLIKLLRIRPYFLFNFNMKSMSNDFKDIEFPYLRLLKNV